MTPEEFDYWLMPASAPRRPLVMGILNVTPDSFSDGGMFSTMMDAMPHTMRMVEEGVDLIDVGGESTRPGASPVPEQEQMSRVFGGVRAARSACVEARSRRLDKTRRPNRLYEPRRADSLPLFRQRVHSGSDRPGWRSTRRAEP